MKAKWNAMDTLLVLMLAAILAAGGWFFLGRGDTKTAAENKTVEVMVELTQQSEEFTKLPKVGDTAVLGEKEKMPATVTKVDILPAYKQGKDILSGRYTDQPIPELYNVQITVCGEGTESDSQVAINGTAIRTGEPMAIKSKDWAGFGFVLAVDAKE